ncbi:MAG: MarR family transcriptional regulator [Candidatus Pristimantibacillus lignocellulolyticus]|uniref:MarR family transcriptional regulator n=1 Tax=Candidatus Pristimantibacillus lignocellulolyticus TaxID=2994561 RepID=A0A9J6ZKP7_9BACL|nr:MAG: MarR family transcriptional regulator [Candidatus Pristimantibacillus lignocellulolyticus]
MEIQGKEPLMSVGFLLGATYRKVTALLMHRLKDFDITPEQWSVLYHVADDEGMIQKEIAARTFKDKPTVTRILHQLEHKGFIVRKEDNVDRRSVRIYATEQGRQLIADTTAIEESISDEVRACIGIESHDQLKQYLMELNSYFDKELETEV